MSWWWFLMLFLFAVYFSLGRRQYQNPRPTINRQAESKWLGKFGIKDSSSAGPLV